jgi:excisionase family DNA binding protein
LPEFMTMKEISKELQISERTLMNYRTQGDFPRVYKFGRHLRVKRADFEFWVSERPEALTRKWLQDLITDD